MKAIRKPSINRSLFAGDSIDALERTKTTSSHSHTPLESEQTPLTMLQLTFTLLWHSTARSIQKKKKGKKERSAFILISCGLSLTGGCVCLFVTAARFAFFLLFSCNTTMSGTFLK